ncbi:MAG: hypothetical protein SFX74_12300 [Fimbriimonadaceae bacterium]|nr:hypothetical protein [Fimbriimonadaceae bacterium]
MKNSSPTYGTPESRLLICLQYVLIAIVNFAIVRALMNQINGTSEPNSVMRDAIAAFVTFGFAAAVLFFSPNDKTKAYFYSFAAVAMIMFVPSLIFRLRMSGDLGPNALGVFAYTLGRLVITHSIALIPLVVTNHWKLAPKTAKPKSTPQTESTGRAVFEL